MLMYPFNCSYVALSMVLSAAVLRNIIFTSLAFFFT